jgi:hypothetical protein
MSDEELVKTFNSAMTMIDSTVKKVALTHLIKEIANRKETKNEDLISIQDKIVSVISKKLGI